MLDEPMPRENALNGPTEIWFGSTKLRVAAGALVDQPVEGLIVAGNSRGVLGAGPSGALRSAAGVEVERESRQGAPHELGSAIITGPGLLERRGVRNLIHAIVSEDLGIPPRTLTIAPAVTAALRLARDARLRSVALPLVGIDPGAPQEERMEAAERLIELLVAHVRRSGARLDEAIVVSRFEDDVPTLTALVQSARQRLWTGPA